MAKPDVSAYTSFDQITGRLDEIIEAVRSKDTSLERSLDLFDEALALGTVAVELVDTTDFTPEEEERLLELAEDGEEADGARRVDDDAAAEAVSGTDAVDASSDDGPDDADEGAGA